MSLAASFSTGYDVFIRDPERQTKQSMNILFLTLSKFNNITEQGITILLGVNLFGFVKIGECSEDVNKDASYKL